MRLDGKVAIVTGAGQGIGRAYALRLAQEGARVAVAEIQAAKGEQTAAAIRATGGQAIALPTDVSDEASTEAMARATAERFGRIDALVNNAAIFYGVQRKPFDQLTVAEWDRLYSVNVRGVWLCCKAVVPYMRQHGYGKIVNIASDTVLSGIPYLLHYVSSKGAVIALTRALARELGGENICVNAVAPGFTLSEAGQSAPDETKERSVAGRPLHRAEVPADLAGTIAFLVSAESDFITGQTLAVNGGYVSH
ncbi:MAG TPA: 3-oxoacyl-ACP reductase family protein [Chloroflexota bacterium]|jgi:3-oxoacyl-[acyl-carrier protein] reductase